MLRLGLNTSWPSVWESSSKITSTNNHYSNFLHNDFLTRDYLKLLYTKLCVIPSAYTDFYKENQSNMSSSSFCSISTSGTNNVFLKGTKEISNSPTASNLNAQKLNKSSFDLYKQRSIQHYCSNYHNFGSGTKKFNAPANVIKNATILPSPLRIPTFFSETNTKKTGGANVKPGLTKDLGVQWVYNLYKSQLDTKLILFYIKKLYEIRKRLFLLENQLLFYTNGFFVYNIRTSKVTKGPSPKQILEQNYESNESNELSSRCSRNIAFRLNNSSTIKPWFQNIQKDTKLQAKNTALSSLRTSRSSNHSLKDNIDYLNTQNASKIKQSLIRSYWIKKKSNITSLLVRKNQLFIKTKITNVYINSMHNPTLGQQHPICSSILSKFSTLDSSSRSIKNSIIHSQFNVFLQYIEKKLNKITYKGKRDKNVLNVTNNVPTNYLYILYFKLFTLNLWKSFLFSLKDSRYHNYKKFISNNLIKIIANPLYLKLDKLKLFDTLETDTIASKENGTNCTSSNNSIHQLPRVPQQTYQISSIKNIWKIEVNPGNLAEIGNKFQRVTQNANGKERKVDKEIKVDIEKTNVVVTNIIRFHLIAKKLKLLNYIFLTFFSKDSYFYFQDNCTSIINGNASNIDQLEQKIGTRLKFIDYFSEYQSIFPNFYDMINYYDYGTKMDSYQDQQKLLQETLGIGGDDKTLGIEKLHYLKNISQQEQERKQQHQQQQQRQEEREAQQEPEGEDGGNTGTKRKSDNGTNSTNRSTAQSEEKNAIKSTSANDSLEMRSTNENFTQSQSKLGSFPKVWLKKFKNKGILQMNVQTAKWNNDIDFHKNLIEKYGQKTLDTKSHEIASFFMYIPKSFFERNVKPKNWQEKYKLIPEIEAGTKNGTKTSLKETTPTNKPLQNILNNQSPLDFAFFVNQLSCKSHMGVNLNILHSKSNQSKTSPFLSLNGTNAVSSNDKKDDASFINDNPACNSYHNSFKNIYENIYTTIKSTKNHLSHQNQGFNNATTSNATANIQIYSPFGALSKLLPFPQHFGSEMAIILGQINRQNNIFSGAIFQKLPLNQNSHFSRKLTHVAENRSTKGLSWKHPKNWQKAEIQLQNIKKSYQNRSNLINVRSNLYNEFSFFFQKMEQKNLPKTTTGTNNNHGFPFSSMLNLNTFKLLQQLWNINQLDLIIKHNHSKTQNASILVENMSRFAIAYLKKNKGGKNKFQQLKNISLKIMSLLLLKPITKNKYLGAAFAYSGRVYGGKKAASFKMLFGSVPFNQFDAHIDYSNIIQKTRNGTWNFSTWLHLKQRKPKILLFKDLKKKKR